MVLRLSCPLIPLSPSTSLVSSSSLIPLRPSFWKYPARTVLPKCMSKEEPLLEGLPKEYYDDEWQAQRREKTKELHRKRQEEEEEEERKVEEYREIAMRMKGYPPEEVLKARQLVSSFIRSAEEVEESLQLCGLKNTLRKQYAITLCYKEKIEQAAEKGELNELVLLVLWNRLDLARRDDEKDAVRGLDLLYRRVEMEILKREATPAMSLLNDLLNLHDGNNDEDWLKECKKCMIEAFPREDPFSILVPAGLDVDKHQGPIRPSLEADNILLRVDFVREVDELLREVRCEMNEEHPSKGLDPETVANRFKQQEKQRTVHLVESLLDLAINLHW